MRERPWFDFWWMRQQRKLKDQQQTSRERERWAMWPVRSNVIREVEEVIWHWTNAGAELYIHIRTVTKSPKSFPRNWGWENEIQERIFWEIVKKNYTFVCDVPGLYRRKPVTYYKTRTGMFLFCFFFLGGVMEGRDNLHSNQSKFTVTRLRQIADWWIRLFCKSTVHSRRKRKTSEAEARQKKVCTVSVH